MDAVPLPIRFPCPSCRQKLSIQPEFAGQPIACPSCGTPTTVPVVAQRSGSLGSKAAAAGLFLATLGGSAFLLNRKSDPPVSAGVSEPASSLESTSAQEAKPSSNLADQIYGKPIKRSGSSDWEVAFAYYSKTAGATQIMFSAQERKGKLAILPGRLVVDQVGDGFIMASHTGSQEQWVLHPDNPKALEEIALTEGTSIVQLVGVYAGPEQMETVDGAPRRIPAMIVFGMLTNKGYVDLEDPKAARASAVDHQQFVEARDSEARRVAEERSMMDRAQILKDNAREEQRAKEKAEKDARAVKQRAEDEAAYAADVLKREKALAEKEAFDRAELEKVLGKDPNGPAPSRQVEAGTPPERSPEAGRANELAKAKADLAAVQSKIDSERKRHADALGIINTLTLNKTRPVKEGSAAYFRCQEASRIIEEVEKGAPDLKAEKARLETLVGELAPDIQE